MRIIFIILIMVFWGSSITAQTHELGVFAGGSTPISDVGQTYYVLPNQFAWGVLYRWNFHERMSLRVQITKTKLVANDIDSDIVAKRARQYYFNNELTEVSVGGEYHFFDFDMHNRLDRPYTPYIYGGISYFWYDDLYFDRRSSSVRPLGATNTLKRNKDFAIPIGLGIKAKVGMRLVVGAEIGTRFTFTNNLDGSMPDDISLSFGNKMSNDWYTFTGVFLTYTFGEKPCYCN